MRDRMGLRGGAKGPPARHQARIIPMSSPLEPVLPPGPGRRVRWGHLYGASRALAIARERAPPPGTGAGGGARHARRPPARGRALASFSAPAGEEEILHFPDWETLPYDLFSPHQDIVSERLLTLYRLALAVAAASLIVPVGTLMGRLAPPEFVHGSTMVLVPRRTARSARDPRPPGTLRLPVRRPGHGSRRVRGARLPPRSLSQRLRASAAHRSPRRRGRQHPGLRPRDPALDRASRPGAPAVGAGVSPHGGLHRSDSGARGGRDSKAIRSDCPVLPRGERRPQSRRESSTTCRCSSSAPPPSSNTFRKTPSRSSYEDVHEAARALLGTRSQQRFENARHDRERPLLPPSELFLAVDETFARLKSLPASAARADSRRRPGAASPPTTPAFPVGMPVNPQARENPSSAFERFLAESEGRTLVVAESAGRREQLARRALRRRHPARGLRRTGAAFLEGDAARSASPWRRSRRAHGCAIPPSRL